LKITNTPIDGFVVIEPKCYEDERGFFLESFQAQRYRDAGIRDVFLQDNQSRSSNRILRGLHFQVLRPQAQIVTVMRGRVFDVGVDLRPDSPTFGKAFGIELSDSGGPRQVYMATGFAHGFCVLSEWADLHYKCSRIYDSGDEGGVCWNDPALGIDWPLEQPIVSHRDSGFPMLKDLEPAGLPHNPPVEARL
jgi:dTDP-4-dehydrorhamnose 3,5-epimerase